VYTEDFGTPLRYFRSIFGLTAPVILIIVIKQSVPTVEALAEKMCGRNKEVI
jgi:hypothetical protein